MKFVRQIVDEHPDARRILDPFSGTGTTPLCAAEYGHEGLSLDINPFLVWFGTVKVARYDDATIERVLIAVSEISSAVRQGLAEPCSPPPIRNIERWWAPESLTYLCTLKAAVDRYRADGPVHDLLRVMFCRTLIAVSNAAFNHQSMSFKKKRGANAQLAMPLEGHRLESQFANDATVVAGTAADNPEGTARVIGGDSRTLDALVHEGVEPFDLLITSPPYPNRMSYIRELRPYMYWLTYLVEAREAGELDWEAIGGTWGIATSRLKDWQPSQASTLPGYLFPILDEVCASHPTNGPLLANYVHKYFDDIHQHLESVGQHLRRGATAHYIVGNSTFYGHLVPVERIYADLMTGAGFEDVAWKVVRKRNSKKELFEYVVSGKWTGK